MPRVKTTAPEPTREKGQRSIDLPLYLDRVLPFWGQPEWLNAEAWRNIVNRQPLAVACRETLIANLINLDWKIEPKESTQRDENKSEIRYYEKFFQDTGDYDYTEIIDWIVADTLDIPFGGAAEIGREGDDPKGRVLWLELLDGATLFPTLNDDHPVGQKVKEVANKVVYFPYYAINRLYYSPRREIKRKGWGMPPPEKIFLALELLNRGDIYYANLLLDTPASGILDLGDMAKDSASEWVKAWRDMLTGIDPFKIPVLYEHEKPVNWIPFTRNPADLMFDKALFRYGALVTAGYGMTLSDIGVPTGMSGGETLAGTIRQERQTRKTGFAKLKKKVKYWFDRMLPDTLRFSFIDLDDELNIAIGRARLATSTAWQQMVSAGMFTPEEGRQQMIADGLITISVPEALPEEARQRIEQQLNPPSSAERPTMLGRPVSPSQGGYGEQKADFMIEPIRRINSIDNTVLLRDVYRNFTYLRAEIELVADALGLEVLDAWDAWYDQVLDGKVQEIPDITFATLSNLRFDFTNFLDIKSELDAQRIKSSFIGAYSAISVEKNKAKFIRGEVDELSPLSIETSTLEIAAYDYINEIVAVLNDAVKKGIISGTRKFVLDNPGIQTPDELLGTNILSYVLAAIDNYTNKSVSYLQNRISDIINKIVDGDNTDGST